MKFLFIASFVPSFAFAANLTCANIEMLDQDANGNPIFTPSKVNIEILPSAAGKRGLVAVITNGNNKDTVTDVEDSTVAAADVDIEDMAAFLRPDIKWSDVAKVRVGNIGVDANLEDGAGMFIFELLDAKGGTLGKIAQVGWGSGRCH